MSQIEIILHKYLGNSTMFIDYLKDNLYTLFLKKFIIDFEEILKEEREALEKLTKDSVEYRISKRDYDKSMEMLEELRQVTLNVKDNIRNRYML